MSDTVKFTECRSCGKERICQRGPGGEWLCPKCMKEATGDDE